MTSILLEMADAAWFVLIGGPAFVLMRYGWGQAKTATDPRVRNWWIAGIVWLVIIAILVVATTDFVFLAYFGIDLPP